MSAEDIELAMNATLAGEEPDEPDQDEVEQHDDEPADEPDAPIAAERPGWLPEKFKTPEDMAQSYAELERQFHSRQQPDPEPEPEVDEEAFYAPTMAMPIGGAPQSVEQLDAWIAQAPADAAMWVLSNQESLSQDIVKQTVDAWAAMDPVGFTQFNNRAVAAQLEQQYEARLAELEARLAPHDAAQSQQANLMMAQMVKQAIPEWDSVRDQVRPLLEQHPVFAPAFASAATPQARAEVVQMAYKQYAWDQYQTQQRQAPTPANNPAPPRAATRTRQSAAEVEGDDSEAAQIVRMGNEMRGTGRR